MRKEEIAFCSYISLKRQNGALCGNRLMKDLISKGIQRAQTKI